MYCYIVKMAISRLLQYCSQKRPTHIACFIMSYMLCVTDFEKICLHIDSFKFV